VALALRVLYVVVFAADLPRPITDRFFYHEVANLLVAGQGFIEPFQLLFTGAQEPSAGHPPLWPLLLAVASFFGADTWTAHMLVGALVGTAAVYVTGLLGRRIGGAAVGLLAATLAALYPTLIAADGSLMSESLYGLLVALALLVAYRFLGRPTPAVALSLGALLGLAALARAEALLLIALLGVPLSLRLRPWRWAGARILAVIAVGAALVVAPWTLRNWSAFGEPVLISTNDSTVAAGANCDPTYRGRDIGTWSLTCLSPRRPGLDEAAQAGIWREQGVDYAFDHVERWPAVVAVRVLRTWDLYQPRDQARQAEGREPTVQEVGTYVYLVLLVLAIYGLVTLRARGRPVFILLAPAIAVTVTSVVGFGLPRFRHPVEIPIVVLSAVAVAALVARAAERERSPAGGAVPAS
jgi:hypothetical protein